MKKQVITIAIGVLTAAAVFTALFVFVQTIVRDHKAIGQVVTFINNSIAAQQQQSPASAVK